LKATNLGDRENYLCSCREKIQKCSFWTGVSQDMLERGFNFDIANAGTDIRHNCPTYIRWLLQPLHRGVLLEKIRDIALSLSPSWKKNLAHVQHLNANLIQCVLSRTGKKIIIDSSKIGIRLKYLLRNPDLDVKIIRLIRDGRGVALTYRYPSKFADASDPGLHGGGTGRNKNDQENLSMKEASYEWRRSNEEAETILKSIDPSCWKEVRYEGLCTDTEEILQQLFNFIGVDAQRGQKNYRSVEHHIVGNGMRLDSHSEIKLDERWRKELTPTDLDVFENIAGVLNFRLGYQ
jgi:hypothetical protein